MDKTTVTLPRPLPIQPEELNVLSPPDKLSVAEWAEQHRQLSPKTTHLAGNWSHEYTPFLVEPMQALSDIGTRQITIQKCTQAGGSELANNFLGWAVDQDPGPMLIVMPRESDASRRVNTRIKPMFESTATLRRHLPAGRTDNLNIGRETVLDNMILFIAWAGSAAALADNPIRFAIADEVGKFPVRSGKEADPISLLKKRLRTFYAVSKLLVISTPVLTGDLIHREFCKGDQRRWWAKCYKCKEYQILKWSNVQLDKDKAGKLLAPEDYETGRHARYVCDLCKKPWEEQERWEAVSSGKWAQAGCWVKTNGKIEGKIRSTIHRSYHITALMLYPGFQTI